MDLSPVEQRVLGALAEKALATPQQYPLTEASLIAACNQATNREPVTAYEQAEVRAALVELRRQGLAVVVHRQGDRTEKHAHRLDRTLGLEPPAIAVLALLLLRGPQTVGELRTRSARLHPFAETGEVEAVLAALADHEPALVARLPRQPGQKEARWTHLLAGEHAVSHADAAPAATPAAPPAAQSPAAATPRAAAAPPQAGADEIATLRSELAALRARVAALESALGIGDDS